MNRLKNTALLIITLAFLFESSDVLVNIDLCLHRFVAQHESEEASSANLTHFTFSNADFSNLNWTEGSKEFELNNKRFDVTSIKHFFNRVIVFAKSDSKEDMLLGLLNNFHKNTQKNSVLLKSVKSYCLPSTIKCNTIEVAILKTYFPLISIHSIPAKFFSPPPNLG